MTIQEKLRFLADRVEDEKEFYISDYLFIYQNGLLMIAWDVTEKKCKFIKSEMTLESIIWLDLKLKSQWEFTEDEKVILRNLPDDYQWMARDGHVSGLFGYTSKPTKRNLQWKYWIGNMRSLECFNHLFQSIQWSDDEPCHFRDYL